MIKSKETTKATQRNEEETEDKEQRSDGERR